MFVKKSKWHKKGSGWLPNYLDRRDWDFDRLALPTVDFPGAISHAAWVPEVLDQGATNSCVGNAVAGAIGILETRAGIEYIPMSRLYLYYNARARHSSNITDTGTYIKECVWGMSRAGVPNESIWPFARSKVNKRPSWNSYMKAYGRKDAEYYFIFSTGEQRINEIKTALVNNYPIVFGTGIGAEFYDLNNDAIVDTPTEKLGGHAMVIIGYIDTPDGTLYEILNSWGSDWGLGGRCYFTEDYIRWLRTRDFTIIKGWKWLRDGQ